MRTTKNFVPPPPPPEKKAGGFSKMFSVNNIAKDEAMKTAKKNVANAADDGMWCSFCYYNYYNCHYDFTSIRTFLP